MGGLNSQEITFSISADSVYLLVIAWSAAAAGAMGGALAAANSLCPEDLMKHVHQLCLSPSFPALMWVFWFAFLSMES